MFHIHGVWMYPQLVAARFCEKHKIPFLLSCHGMYEPWLWSKGKFKKKMYFNILANNYFSKATFIHAITPQEKVNLQNIFKRNKIVEIPNLIQNFTSVNHSKPKIDDKYILYLGRLDEKKGIDILLESISNLKNFNLSLKIAGSSNDYKIYLEKLVVKLGLEKKVEFLGLVKGKEKLDYIRNAFVLVAPSHSEVIGMVNLEAAVLKTPVITTYQTGLNSEWNTNGGRLVNPNVLELEKVLEEIQSWTFKQRNINGEKLSSFVIKKYSWEKRFNDWLKLYKNTIDDTN